MSQVRCGICDGAGDTAAAFGVRLLIDNALPPRLAELLKEAGHDADDKPDWDVEKANSRM